jgi:WD40 repeat protein
VKILDFGLARLARTPDEPLPAAADTAAGLTGAGTVMGTAEYVAPEQATDPRTADIRADIYSLGCTLFHLLAGRPPFEGGTVPEKIARHASAPVPPLTVVPPGLAAVVARMTAKDPAQRYATPAEVAEALAPFTEAGAARPRRPRKRLLIAVALGLAVGLVAVAGIILRIQTESGEVVVETEDKSLELIVREGGRIVRIRDPKNGDSWDVDTKDYRISAAAQPNGLTIELPRKGTITLRRRDGGTVTVTTRVKGIALPSGQPARPKFPTAEELAQRPNAADGLKYEDVPELARAYLGGGDAKKSPKELVTLFGDVRFRLPNTAAAPLFSPDGKRILVSCKGRIHTLDATTGLITRSIPAPYWDNKPAAAALAPDNRTLAVGSYKQVELWDLETGKRLHLLKFKDDDPGMWMTRLTFSPDGKHLAAGCWLSNQVRVWDVDTGRRRFWWDGRTEDRPHGGVNQVAFSADRRMLVVLDRDHKLLCWDVPANGDFRAINAPAGYPAVCKGVFFSADGQAVAFKKADKDEVVVHDRKGALLGSWSVATQSVLTFTSDNRTLLSFQVEGQRKAVVRRWDVATRKLLPDVELPAFQQNNLCAFSPDGRTLAVIPGEYDTVVRLVDTTTGKYLHPDPGPTQGVYPLIFSPDGNYLAALDRHRGYLWNLATRELVRSWSARGYETFAFHPDGKVLAFASEAGIVLETIDGRHLHTLEGPKQAMNKLAFSPDGKLLAAGGGSTNVWVWDTDTGKLVHVLEQRQFCDALTFSRDGRFLYTSAGKESCLTAWELSTGKQLFTGRGELLAQVLAARADLKTIAVLDFDAGYRLLDGKTGECTKPRFLPTELGCDEMPGAIAPGGDLVAVSTSKGSLVLWQPNENQQRYRLIPMGSGQGERLSAVAFSPDGRYVAVAGQQDGTIAVLRLSEQGKLPEVQVRAPTARELAERPNAADALKHEDVPELARAYLGGGDPKKAPPELVAVLGDAGFRLPWAVEQWEAGKRHLFFSPDGKHLAVRDGRRALRVFDAATGRVVRDLQIPLDPVIADVSDAAFSPDGKTLALAAGKHLELWDLAKGERQLRVDGSRPLTAVAFRPDGKQVVVAEAGVSKREDDPRGGGRLKVTDVTGFRLLWLEVKTGRWARTYARQDPRPCRDVDRLAFSPDGKTLAALGRNGLFLWKAAEEDPRFLHVRGLGQPAFSPDSKRMVVGGVPEVVDLATDQVKPLTSGQNTGFGFVGFSGNGETIFAAKHHTDSDGSLIVQRWDAATAKERDPVIIAGKDLAFKGGNVWAALSPDGATLAAAVENQWVVRLFDAATGKPQRPEIGSSSPLAFSPDGKSFLALEGDQLIEWDLATGRVGRSPVKGRLGGIGAFSPDWQVVAVQSWDKWNSSNQWIELRRTKDQSLMHLLKGHTGYVWSAVFSPDGKRLATGGSDRTVRVWRVQDGKLERTLGLSASADRVAFTPDGTSIITLERVPEKGKRFGEEDKCLRVWDAATGEERRSWVDQELHPYSPSPVFLPDGRSVALPDRHGRLRVWDWKTGAFVKTVPEAPWNVDARFSLSVVGPAGRLMAAYGSNVNGLLVRDLNPARPGLRRLRLAMPVSGPVFSADGRYLAATTQDGLICLFRLAERGKLPEWPVHVPDAEELGGAGGG